MRAAHGRYERVHQHWRDRYRVAADDHQLRPKRRGVACQQLRANAALLIEWLLILWREGWLGSARRNPAKRICDEALKTVKEIAEDAVTGLLAARRALGLNMP